MAVFAFPFSPWAWFSWLSVAAVTLLVVGTSHLVVFPVIAWQPGVEVQQPNGAVTSSAIGIADGDGGQTRIQNSAGDALDVSPSIATKTLISNAQEADTEIPNRRLPDVLSSYPPTEEGTFSQLVDHFSFKSDRRFEQQYLAYDKFWKRSSESGETENGRDFALLRPGAENGGEESADLHEKAGPILFYMGNEGPIERFYNVTSVLFDSIAPKLGALILFVEHRCYGKSTILPEGESDEIGVVVRAEPKRVRGEAVEVAQGASANNDLTYLTIEQALADFAAFIVWFLRKKGASESPVFLFGGSYGGMLAAWFRVKYPHLSTGAVLSSAPIDFYPPFAVDYSSAGAKRASASIPRTLEFWDAARHTFEVSGGSACAQQLQRGVDRLSLMKPVDGHVLGDGVGMLTRRQLGLIFNTCESEPDVTALKYFVKGALASLAMVNYPYPWFLTKPLPANPVRAACAQLVPTLALAQGKSGAKKHQQDELEQNTRVEVEHDVVEAVEDLLERLNRAVDVYGDPQSCKNTSLELLTSSSPLNKTLNTAEMMPNKPDESMSPWNYQACTELPMQPLTSNLLGFYPPDTQKDLGVLIANCRERFGVFTRPDSVPLNYGPVRMSQKQADSVSEEDEHLENGGSGIPLTNAIVVDGELDPWRVGSFGGGQVFSNKNKKNNSGESRAMKDGLLDVAFLESSNVLKIRPVKGAAHHQDLIAESPADSPELKAARALILETLQKWTRGRPQSRSASREDEKGSIGSQSDGKSQEEDSSSVLHDTSARTINNASPVIFE
ncbi:unnamed protein product [Amoebophrya sp. A25]|nr:unnamed protein product [Amoebophrya sp. A25]|eukprot:GSA25T00024350001.1